MKLSNSFLPLLLAFTFSLSAQHNNLPPSETDQFDFWIGKWRVEWTDNEGNIQHGTNTINKILNGFVIEENFDGNPSMPFVGRSFSVYSPLKKKWLQTWVDNSGGYLDFEGEFDEGKMTLRRSFVLEGKEIIQRMIFYNISRDSLDWNWEVSGDGGNTYELRWKIHYVRMK